ncbi:MULTISPECIES: peptidoglycan-associated lipoprotein Pal [Pseudorhizobium]|jgi:peptidoglycan-associated lipoprotein|uniref:Peptidoglycan-associated lipoprotein n=1 Tax=Pseudorhizobium pelagicum TaxID=1509405 RepID=A0A922NZQ7_9HYPH|nr:MULTISPECIES: peptidoglycan-associated lipoprotein Pal [Pseudorhizobium]MBA4784845.1 peptidoglycan-associated lipoprotein Pal [Hyphomicrobiales bacterium]MBU1316644.1 peptidoglycan-associated lipoprotein Pal [Alphaproteobacteria bacterium]MDY6961152.1 peptidoglycan-associated lipoprotein Pal [Pseudomonadota bacterium]KEQ06541.1 membrane protein [Pseudorhizobium pelagicum]KEQ09697.1 membrane protein [Pseudorhizobium pelagicum]|tara:strand:+ start:428 stop:970 length:543 start_codon:yes stop_codon:yes gene_type:complete
MSRTYTPAISRMQTLARNPAVIALTLALALAGCANKKNLPNNAGDLGLGGAAGAGASTPGSSQDFTVNVGDRIFFDTDSTSIRADAQQTLDRQAQWLARYPNYAITVEGHADERGTREYNLALGARRASATKEYLAARGVPANRIRTISYGKEKPVAVCDDISCWSQNRRAVTVLGGAGM